MKKIFFIILIISSNLLFSQDNTNWYFGNKVGIKFNTIPPSIDPQSQINQWEGCASISDKNGNLLFYSDGMTVWNKNHQIMQNGTGLLGHNSSLVSAYIVQKPGSENIYYLFAIDASERNMYGITYSIVDMSNGSGVITQKNTTLYRNAAPRIAASFHANGRDIWIVTTKQLSAQVHAFLLTDDGFDGTQIISNVGDDVELDQGFMKFNCSGDRMFIANTKQNEIFIVEFDQLYGSAEIKHRLFKNDGVRRWYYSLELSTNQQRLFATTMNPTSVVWFDLSSDNETSINQSMEVLASKDLPFFWGGIEITPLNQIYIANYLQKNLTVITNPNANFDDLEFIENGLNLGNGIAQHGLPSFFRKSCGAPQHLEIIAEPTILCEGSSFTIESSGITSGTFTWSGPNGFSSNQRNFTINNATQSMSGVYTLTVSSGGYTYQAREFIEIQPAPKFELIGKRFLCKNETIKINIKPINFLLGTEYEWSDGQKGLTAVFISEGKYYVTATSGNGCTSVDSIEIEEIAPLFVEINSDQQFCEGETAVLQTNYRGRDYTYKWSTGETTENIAVTKTGKYHVEIQEIDGCKGWDTVFVDFAELPHAEIAGGNLIQVCEGQSAKLQAINKSENTVYFWNDGISKEERFVNTSGKFILVAKNVAGCFAYDTVNVEIVPPPSIEIFPSDTVYLCEGEEITLEVLNVPTTASIKWSTGENSKKIKVSREGEYSVTAKIIDGCSDSAKVYVKVDASLTVSITGDNEICKGDTAILRSNYSGNRYSYEWSTGENTSSINVTEEGTYTLKVTSQSGCTGESSYKIFSYQRPEIKLNNSGIINLCDGQTLLIEPIEINSTFNYYWNDGFNMPIREITKSGKYILYADNKGHCLDSAIVEAFFHEIPESKILSPDGNSLCYEPQIRLISENYNSEFDYTWSTGENTQEIIVGKTGIYTLKVENEFGCFSIDSIEIVKSGEYQVEIIADKEFLCDGDEVNLSLNENFVSYNWSNGETSKTIRVNKAGSYSVVVFDEFGCSGTDEIEIEEYEINVQLINENNSDFGKICYNDSKSQTLEVISIDSEIQISSIEFDNNSFDLESEFSGLFPANQSIKIPVKFTPNQLGEINSIMTINISSPCKTTTDVALQGIAYSKTKVSIPDLIAKVNTENYLVPVNIDEICDVPAGISSDYEITLSFNMKYFYPESADKANIKSSEIIEDMHYTTLNGTFDFSSSALTGLRGLTLLGDNRIVPINIESFEWSNDFIENVNESGSIDIEGVCREDFFVINFFEPTQISVNPNPANDIINIKIDIEELGEIQIAIFDLNSRLIFEKNIYNTGKNNYNLEIDVNHFISGAYMMQITTPLYFEIKRILINK